VRQVNTSESMWTISSTKSGEGSQVVINIEKIKQTWWKHVIVGHPEIDTSKVWRCVNINVLMIISPSFVLVLWLLRTR
jgi:hypothetical protein